MYSFTHLHGGEGEEDGTDTAPLCGFTSGRDALKENTQRSDENRDPHLQHHNLPQRGAGRQKLRRSAFCSRSATASRRDLGPLPHSSAATWQPQLFATGASAPPEPNGKGGETEREGGGRGSGRVFSVLLAGDKNLPDVARLWERIDSRTLSFSIPFRLNRRASQRSRHLRISRPERARQPAEPNPQGLSAPAPRRHSPPGGPGPAAHGGGVTYSTRQAENSQVARSRRGARRALRPGPREVTPLSSRARSRRSELGALYAAPRRCSLCFASPRASPAPARPSSRPARAAAGQCGPQRGAGFNHLLRSASS